MKLSVLYLVNIPSPYRVSFFNELGKYCDLTVVFERKESSEREKEWHDYNFENFKGVFLKGIEIGANSGFDFRVKSYLNTEDFDVIVVGNYSTPSGIYSINYLNFKKIPFVLSVDGGMIDAEESRLKYLLKKSLISSATGWLSTGEFTNHYLTYYGAKEDLIHIYPFTTLKRESVVDERLTVTEKNELRTDLDIPYDKMVISVGRLIPSKGFDVLIEASRQFKTDTGVYIIGGEPTNEYKELINQYDINNVHFINFLEYEELKKYYLAADVFVLPTREDVWGLVINEAMANALPVITTTSCVAGLEMIDENINGYLVLKDNVDQLVEKTNYILDNSNLRAEMSKDNLVRANEYTIENMAETTIEILRGFVK